MATGLDAGQMLTTQLERLDLLRGTGPVPTDYGRWVDATIHLLKAHYGEGSPEVARFYDAVGWEGSSIAQKLPLQGAWGIWARLQRAEAELRALLSVSNG